MRGIFESSFKIFTPIIHGLTKWLSTNQAIYSASSSEMYYYIVHDIIKPWEESL